MIRSKRGAKILGLCVIALGLVAFYTSASQAEKGASWMVNSKNVEGALTPTVVISSIASEDMTLESKVLGGQQFDLLCKGAEFLGAKLESEGKVGGGNKVKFGGCEVKLNGVVSKACAPHTGALPAGSIESASLKGLMVLHENEGTKVKESLILFEPVSGSTFLKLEFAEGCSIGSSCAIQGKNSVKDLNGELGVEKTFHTVQQGAISELFIISNTPEHKATVLGSAVLALSGAHEGMKWSGLPA
jgi:hypothetical protein